MNAAILRERFQAARASGLRARDAAEHLGVSEGEAIAAHAGHHRYALQTTPLRGPWIELLQALEICGPLMALTRNTTTVHEKTGVYTGLSASGGMGLALGEDIDLRLFLDRWHAGFAVREPATNPANPPAISLQFFDRHGLAMHKIFVREATDRAALEAAIGRFAEPALGYVFTAAPASPPPLDDSRIDAAALASAWAAMQDTHEFFPLLRRFGAERQQALRLVEGRFSQRATGNAVRLLLQEAAFAQTPIMVFVGSPGCIQIHTGPVRRVEPLETPGGVQWINVLDAGFNLHLREDRVGHVWIVEKPTADGVVTSLEAFDTQGELMAMFFGARKPGQPERADWRALVQRMPRPEPAEIP